MTPEQLTRRGPRTAALPLRRGVPALAALAAAVSAVVLAVWFGGGSAAAVPGLPDAGALTRWGLPLARTAMDVAATVTVGALLLVAVLLPGEGRELSDVERRHLNWAACASGVWAVATCATLTFNLSDLFAQPVGDGLTVEAVIDYATSTEQGRPFAVVLAAALLVGVLSTGATRVGTVRWALLVAVAGLVPPAVAGHSAATTDHMTAVVSLAVHIVAAAVWAGGLLFVLGLGLRRDAHAPAVTRTFSRLAGWCLVTVALSGVLSATARLSSPSDLLSTRYGQLVLLKVVALLVLGGCGAWHRRRLLPRLRAGQRGRFVRLAAVEVVLMAATFGLAVGLSRAPAPPSAGDLTTEAEELLGFPMPQALGGFPWTPLFTEWRLDAFFAFGTIAAAAAYAAGARTLGRRGDVWPVGRTVAWMSGLALTVVATMSGFGPYGMVLFSVHMGQHMVLAMAVPILLVLGAPTTLALRALPAAPKGGRPGAREMLLAVVHSRYVAVISHPAVAATLFVGSSFVVYYTPLFGMLMRSHYGHLAMLLHFLAVGCLFFWVIIGIDPGPHRLPPLGKLFVLILTMPFHSWFSISLMSATDLIAADWWQALGRDWGASLADDQYDAGAIAWATGDIPILSTCIAFVVQWVRTDRREARRIDRAIDRGDGNDPLAAYNAYLAGLRARDERVRERARQAERTGDG